MISMDSITGRLSAGFGHNSGLNSWSRARAAALDGLCPQEGSRNRATAAGHELGARSRLAARFSSPSRLPLKKLVMLWFEKQTVVI